MSMVQTLACAGLQFLTSDCKINKKYKRGLISMLMTETSEHRRDKSSIPLDSSLAPRKQ